MRYRVPLQLQTLVIVIAGLVTTQTAFGHALRAEEYLSIGVLYKSPIDSDSDRDEVQSKADEDGAKKKDGKQFGLDLNYGSSFLLGAAGANLKYFEDSLSVGAFATLFGIFVEGGMLQNLDVSKSYPYVSGGLALGYAEFSARRIFDEKKTEEWLVGIKLPLDIVGGSIGLFNP